jgi:ribosomal protein L31E
MAMTKFNVSTKDLIYIKESIERHTDADQQITDVIINYQVKKNVSQRNFLKLNINLR